MLFHILLFKHIAGFTSEDNQLTNHILTTQVDAWVGFRITLFLRQTDGFAERHIGTDLVENEVQRTAHHGFNLQNLVATCQQIVDGLDNRKTGTYIGFEQILHATVTGNPLEFAIVGIR